MKIAVIGDYDQNRPSHLATHKAVQHTAASLSKELFVQWIPTKALEADDNLAQLRDFDGVWGAPGVPDSSLGVINGIQVARETSIPYLGT